MLDMILFLLQVCFKLLASGHILPIVQQFQSVAVECFSIIIKKCILTSDTQGDYQ